MEHQLLSSSVHFFKVLLPGFDQKLRLPPAFCAKVSQEKSKWAKLKTRKGTWNVKVSRDGREMCFEKHGWLEFVDSHSLNIGDFLMFEHVGCFNFNVLVFDPSACEKEFFVELNEDSSDNEESADETTFDGNKPSFALTIQPHHALKKGHLNIPIDFIRSNNLEHKTSATLRDDRGQVWPMRLVIQTVGQFRMHMGKGWRKFYESKKLKGGDVCVFYLTSSSPGSPTISFDVKINPFSDEDMY